MAAGPTSRRAQVVAGCIKVSIRASWELALGHYKASRKKYLPCQER